MMFTVNLPIRLLLNPFKSALRFASCLFSRFSVVSLFILLAAFSLTWTGCFGGGDYNDLIEEGATSEYVTYTGVLQSLGGVKFSSNATHLLRRETGEIVYVYSDFYNLNASQYLNQTLEVSGMLLPPADEKSKEVLAIEALEILETPVDDTTETVRTTYSNEIIGFSMMLRSDWTIKDSATFVTFHAPLSEVTIDVRTMKNTQQLPIADWYEAYILSENTPLHSTLSAVSQDQIPAMQANYPFAVTYYVQDGPQVVVIAYDNPEGADSTDYNNLFSEMLYSFDLHRDGLREVSAQSEAASEAEAATDAEAEVDSEMDQNDSILGGTEYASLVNALNQMSPNEFLTQEGEWQAVRYDFVEPDYVYLIFHTTEGKKARALAQHLGGNDFETIAEFKEGVITDWKLISGEDEAKGKAKTSVHVASGAVIQVPEGYRSLESATLDFQMHYPSSWYYSRFGNHYYFSDKPADAENALVTLSLLTSDEVSGSFTDYYEEFSGGILSIWTPRDPEGGYSSDGAFHFQADASFADILRTMAQSISPTNP